MCSFKKHYLNDKEFLAYEYISASNQTSPTIVYLPGYKSDMSGIKATKLREFTIKKDYHFLRFDYLGTGYSYGKFEDYLLSDWINCSHSIISELANENIILVGSSMGGHIMLVLSEILKNRVKGLIGIAPAIDFTEKNLINSLSSDEKSKLKKEGRLKYYKGGREYFIDLEFIQDAEKFMFRERMIKFWHYVTIIHGMDDDIVEYSSSIDISNKVKSENSKIILLKNSGHRLSSEKELEVILSEINYVCKKIK